MNQRLFDFSRTVLCCLFVSLVLALGCGKPTTFAEWKPFSPPGGKFTVLMPGTPVEEVPKTNTGLEPKKYRIVTAMSNISSMAIAYADQPPQAGGPIDPKKLLDSLRDQAVSDLRGQLIHEQAVSVQGGYPGREWRMSVPGGFTALQRTYLVNRRLYSLIVIAGSKGLNSPEAARFLNSFQVYP